LESYSLRIKEFQRKGIIAPKQGNWREIQGTTSGAKPTDEDDNGGSEDCPEENGSNILIGP